ncbi:MAG: hypothetical protein KF857_02405 [Fimbriimonadaceae bacterium]|nr:hypothetical protein [Fimbriimonadaceae bacterium]
MVTLTPCADSVLAGMLSGHPLVRWGEGAPTAGCLQWEQGGWRRTLRFDGGAGQVGGLVELGDNNPLVCADVASVPTPLTTLALVALGPLARAGLVAEPPVLVASFDFDAPDLDRELTSAGLGMDVVVQVDPRDLGGVRAVTALVEVPTLSDMSEIDGLYDESYGRSFFVKEADGDWDTALVAGRPGAVYRVRQTPGDPNTLLTVQAMADRDGKCGAAQVVHTFNVMCGHEESLGLA